jgi:hypothetical protein
MYAGVATKLDAASMVQESFADYRSDGVTYSGSSTAGRPTWNSAGTVIGVAIDCDNGAIYFANANTWITSGVPTSGASRTGAITTYTGGSKTLFGGFGVFNTTPSITGCVNFGQRPFTCTANLPAVAIAKPASYFDVKTRTGTGAAFNVTGEAFQPDLVWTKGRSGATDHAIYDAVRGVTKDIGTNLATDQTTQAQGVTAFNADGFSGGTLAKINTNAATYIDWMWKESVTAGLDIVAVTGNGANRTVAHNLGVVPKMIIGKSLTTAGADTGWPVYHASLANTEYLMLNTTAAKATGATYWNSTTPTSSVFSLGTAADVNTNADIYIYYAFAEIAGFSKFGIFAGNGSADGPFVWCGFRPKFIVIKRQDLANSWEMMDSARDPYNIVSHRVEAERANAETVATPDMLDFLSNGFKIKTSDVGWNGTSMVFAAFAEFPFGGSNVSPSPAR